MMALRERTKNESNTECRNEMTILHVLPRAEVRLKVGRPGKEGLRCSTETEFSWLLGSNCDLQNGMEASLFAIEAKSEWPSGQRKKIANTTRSVADKLNHSVA